MPEPFYPIRRHVQLSPGHAERLRLLAEASGITQSEMVRRLIDQAAQSASGRPIYGHWSVDYVIAEEPTS